MQLINIKSNKSDKNQENLATAEISKNGLRAMQNLGIVSLDTYSLIKGQIKAYQPVLKLNKVLQENSKNTASYSQPVKISLLTFKGPSNTISIELILEAECWTADLALQLVKPLSFNAADNKSNAFELLVLILSYFTYKHFY